MVRHGETELNKLGQMQGWVDSPLTENGVEIAQLCGLGLKEIPFDVAYSSDLMRAVKTTEIILNQRKIKSIPHHQLFDLREISFGKFGGGYRTDYRIACSEVLFGEKNLELLNNKLETEEISIQNLIDAGYSLNASGETENFTSFEARIVKSIHEILETAKKNDHEKILVVTHGLAIFALLNAISKNSVRFIHEVKNASVSVLTYQNNQIEVKDIVSMNYINVGQELKNK